MVDRAVNRCLAELYLPRAFGALTASEGKALMSALHTMANEFEKRENLNARMFRCFTPFQGEQESADA